MTDTALLAAESVGKTFGSRKVLNSASLWVHPGRITALVGRNGEGKSTLLKIASGQLRPDYGMVRFGEERFTRPRFPDLARRGVFFLPERSLLCRSRTLREHLRVIEYHFGRGRIDEAVEMLRLGDLLRRSPHQLSGGERRRAELALAVARAPRCLLADEPFMGIVPKDAEFLSGVFRWLSASGCAVALTGHEVASLFETADEVLWMTAGTTHTLGPPAEAAEHRQFAREYLGLGKQP